MAGERTNVIYWDDAGSSDILWEYDQEYIRTMSSLTVNAWQWAIFIRDGQIIRVFDEGKYTLTTANIPVLTKIVEKLQGYKEDVFKAKVLFISKRQLQGKWGIRTMTKVAQDYMAPIPLMANGDFTYRVNNPELFVTQLVAGLKNYTTGSVTDFMKSFIAEQLTQQLGKQYYMDVFENLEKASLTTKINIEEDFKNRGIELLALKIGSVSTEEKYQEDIYKFQQFRASGGTQWKQFEVMGRMADAIGESEGGAAMGAGMMLFPQMYQQLSQQPGQQGQPKVLCPYCGQANNYPYNFCGHCGKQSPQAAPMQQQAPPVQQQTNVAATSGDMKKFNKCPYCGEDISSLPKTPKFCPYCAEQLN